MMWTTTFTKHITYAKILILKKQNINPNLSEIIESNISNNSVFRWRFISDLIIHKFRSFW